MRFIDRLRVLARKGMNKNTKKEYKSALNTIDSAARNGRYNTKFQIALYYENIDEIYEYIINMLSKMGFDVKLEMHGCNMSHKRLDISWR